MVLTQRAQRVSKEKAKGSFLHTAFLVRMDFAKLARSVLPPCGARQKWLCAWELRPHGRERTVLHLQSPLKRTERLFRSDCHLQDTTIINASTPCKVSNFWQSAKGDSRFLAKLFFSLKNSVRSVFSVVEFLTSCFFVPSAVKKWAGKR